jgi:hypothetical protein
MWSFASVDLWRTEKANYGDAGVVERQHQCCCIVELCVRRSICGEKRKEGYDDAGVVEQQLEEWELGVWGNHEFVDTSEKHVEGYCVGVGLWYFQSRFLAC